LAVASTAGGFDSDTFAASYFEGVFAACVFLDALAGDEGVHTHLSVVTALESVCAEDASLCEKTDCDFFEEHELSDGPVATIELAPAS
jgi:hypothetical protein